MFIIELSLDHHQVVHLMMRAARQQADKAEPLICWISLRVGCRNGQKFAILQLARLRLHPW